MVKSLDEKVNGIERCYDYHAIQKEKTQISTSLLHTAGFLSDITQCIHFELALLLSLIRSLYWFL